jgi:adenylate cyclase
MALARVLWLSQWFILRGRILCLQRASVYVAFSRGHLRSAFRSVPASTASLVNGRKPESDPTRTYHQRSRNPPNLVALVWRRLGFGVIIHYAAPRGGLREGPTERTNTVNEKIDRPKLESAHAPVEIERKFLVASDEWKHSIVRSESIRDGLIAAYKDRKVRVRISGNTATIAIKGPRTGLTRTEFEYEIPFSDAERMLSTICHDDTLEKQRFFVEDGDAVWQVDVYGGVLEGFVIAEIELKQETEELALPCWIGREVTGDSHYRKINMVARRMGSQR